MEPLIKENKYLSNRKDFSEVILDCPPEPVTVSQLEELAMLEGVAVEFENNNYESEI